VARNCRFDPVDFRDVQSEPDDQSSLLQNATRLKLNLCGDPSVSETAIIL
jgi:hypothetical protein